jgi:hypothetical protein
MSKPIWPTRYIMHGGRRLIEVEWPADGKYDIGYQMAQETERPGKGKYMGLFQLVSTSRKLDAPTDDGAKR